jgi:magnesium transporter
MITARRFRQGVASPDPVDPHALAEARGGDGTLLIVDIVDGTDDELTAMAAQLPIHPLAVDDLRNANQRTKLEHYGDHYHVAVHPAAVSDHEVCIGEVDLLFGKDWFLVVRQPMAKGEPMQVDEVVHRFERMRLEPDADDLGTAVWALLDVIVDRYFLVTDLVDDRLDDIEEIVFSDQPRDAIPQEVFELRRSLLRFRRAVAPLRDVLNEMLRREVDLLDNRTTLDNIRDVFDHVLRISEIVDSQRDLLTGLLEAHLAVVSNRMNQVMKLTSSWGAILLVATLIAGIYGMNFQDMPELKWQFGYAGALGLMAISTLVLYRLFRKRGWF